MPMIITNDEGNEIEVFTPEEIAQKEEQIKAEYEARLAQEAEARENAERRVSEQTHNIKRLRDMSEEQKKQYTAKELEMMAQLENMQTEFETFKTQTEEQKKQQISETIDKAVSMYSNGNNDIAQKIKDNLEIININVVTEQDALLKVEKAVAMAGVSTRNPLSSSFSGVHAPVESKGDERLSIDEFKKLIY